MTGRLLAGQASDWSVVDLEWDANAPGEPLLVFGWRNKAYPVMEEWIREEMADPSITKVAFTKSDIRWLYLHGVKVAGPFHDIQTMAYVHDVGQPLSLFEVSRRYGSEWKEPRIVRRKGVVYFRRDDGELVLIGDAPLDQLMRYNEQDLLSEEDLYLSLTKVLRDEGMYNHWLSSVVPYSRVLARMESVGLSLDVLRTKAEVLRMEPEVLSEALLLKKKAGLPPDFNFNSNPQMMNFLFTREFTWETRYPLSKEEIKQAKAGEWPESLPRDFEPTKIGRVYVYGFHTLKGLGMRPKEKTPTCKEGLCGHRDEGDHLPAVGAKVLKVFHNEDPWVREYIAWKARDKGLQFLRTWAKEQKGGRLYTHFNQTGAETGRLSSSDPVNLQQVPSRGELGKRFRRLFRPERGKIWILGDFDQIEPRLSAHFSQDPRLMEAFENEKDVYEEATVVVLGERFKKGTPQRQMVRTCFLGMQYGSKPEKVRRQLAEEDVFLPMADIKKAYNGLIEYYHVFFEWRLKHIAECESLGYVETLSGHRRRLNWVDPSRRWKAENQAVNTYIQGSAADICAGMMVEVDERLPYLDPVLAVHDEAIWECEDYAARVLETIRECGERQGTRYGVTVPIVFEPAFVSSWGDK